MQAQRIDGTGFPGEGGLATRPLFRFVHCTRRQWITIMQVFLEVLAGLHIVYDRDKAPRDAHFFSYTLIPIAIFV
ncbi:hypothetical protein D3C85_1812700 [compost metagenome]